MNRINKVTVTVTHKDAFPGAKITGEPYDMSGVIEMSDGKVIHIQAPGSGLDRVQDALGEFVEYVKAIELIEEVN